MALDTQRLWERRCARERTAFGSSFAPIDPTSDEIVATADEHDGRRDFAGSSRQLGRHRARRWLIRAAIAGFVLAMVLSLAAFGFELALPSVRGAPARVAAIVRAHHGKIDALPAPARLAAAVVAVEDRHFFSNVFMDVFDGMARGALATVRQAGDPGGSTIDQQLAKQLYPRSVGLGGTLEEIGLGVKLSVTFSKPQILGMYLNSIYYGHGYWGDATAALGYFGTDPDHLSWAQAAMLAGLPQAPSDYDPVQHLALAKKRQRHVLDMLVVNHVLNRAQADAAYRAPLHLLRSAQPSQ